MAPAAAVGAAFVVMGDPPTSPDTLRAEVSSSVNYPGPPTDEPTPEAQSTGDGSTTPGVTPTGSPGSAEPGGTGGQGDETADDDTESGAPARPSEPGTGSPPDDEPSGTATPGRTGSPDPTPSTPPDPTPDPTPTPSSTPDPPQTPTEMPRPTPQPPAPAEPVLSGSERALVDATNRVRARAGCSELRVDARLTAAASGHSADMRNRWYTSHVSPDGRTPADRAAAEGYDGPVGETIEYGGRDAERVVDRWTSRSADRSELLDCSYTSVGVGVESSLLGVWWTQVLGRD